jgi:hypothetical protein
MIVHPCVKVFEMPMVTHLNKDIDLSDVTFIDSDLYNGGMGLSIIFHMKNLKKEEWGFKGLDVRKARRQLGELHSLHIGLIEKNNTYDLELELRELMKKYNLMFSINVEIKDVDNVKTKYISLETSYDVL